MKNNFSNIWYEKYCRFFSLNWYRYLFTDLTGFKHFWCRLRNHPYQVKEINPINHGNYFNILNDHHCSNCDEWLGF
jgi:hypothetical protein